MQRSVVFQLYQQTVLVINLIIQVKCGCQECFYNITGSEITSRAMNTLLPNRAYINSGKTLPFGRLDRFFLYTPPLGTGPSNFVHLQVWEKVEGSDGQRFTLKYDQRELIPTDTQNVSFSAKSDFVVNTGMMMGVALEQTGGVLFEYSASDTWGLSRQFSTFPSVGDIVELQISKQFMLLSMAVTIDLRIAGERGQPGVAGPAGVKGDTGPRGPEGPMPTDMDECTLSKPCQDNAVCQNTFGSYTCVCTTGFIANGSSCINENECDHNNGGCEHNCTDTVGQFFCNCTSGYFLSKDGRSCQDENECLSPTACLEGRCINTPGSFECIAPAKLPSHSKHLKSDVFRSSLKERNDLPALFPWLVILTLAIFIMLMFNIRTFLRTKLKYIRGQPLSTGSRSTERLPEIL